MLRFIIAFAAGKLAKFALRLLRRRATHFPGKLAIKICPDFLKYINKPEKMICVTGTNGKTSTCNMIEDSLRNAGVTVLDNSYGSNTLGGIAATLIDGVNIFNKPKFDTLVLEVDERSSLHIYKHITPTYFVCTNLFRDSMMRNAHTEYIFNMINNYLPTESTLILNGDDVISSRLGKGRNKNRVFFSVDKLPGEMTEDDNIVNDGRACPECGAEMIFDFKRYHHIGKAHCSGCSLRSPDADYRVTSATDKEMTMSFKGGEYKFPIINNAVYNIYNEAATVALLTEYGFEPEKIAVMLSGLHITETRYSDNKIGNISVIYTMLKGLNPIAGSRNCRTAQIRPGTKSVFLMVDDLNHEKEDCENIAWHYEADYEYLNDESIKKVYVAGPRCEDVRYRLLIAGIPNENIETARTEADVIEKMTFDDIDTLMVFYDMFRFDDLENKVKPAIRKKITG